ncbi:class I SAM-dependent methyltransferase [Mesorhizobium sp. SB112]|uniref:class I SAM-dependent methyltransferase n=1 Tax=Mesorhizobium sp. SB112 TaxID=3151853 RepID=UPI003263DF69
MHDEPSVRQGVTDYWNNRAPLFDGAASHIRHEMEWRNVLEAAFEVDGPKRVVDLGSGTGACALLAAGLGHKVTAVDGAASMLDCARQSAEERNLAIDFVISSIEDFQGPPAAFDIVTLRNVLWTMENPLIALQMAAKLLKARGKVVIADALWSKDPANRSAYSNELAKRLPFHAGLTQDDAESLLAQAGFGKPKSWQHYFPAPPYPGNIPYFVISAEV